jgi:hypothetical protein
MVLSINRDSFRDLLDLRNGEVWSPLEVEIKVLSII